MRRNLSALSGPPSLGELVDRARAGESAAIGCLYDTYADALFRTAYRMTGSRSDAEDAVHDLFVGLPGALRRYVEHGQLGAWLNRVVVRLALARMRSDRRQHAAPLDEAYAVISTDVGDAGAELTELQQAVMALPDGLRAVLLLKQVEGYSHDEIGAMLRISTGASRVRLTRAIEMLRRSLR
ncbi:MAG: RNA polymerase sigma factor [Gemmatimonadota bacterium]|nr:RNA polymerase sigma factor [Gemmatimonadota bacterium]